MKRKKNYRALAERALRLMHRHPEPVLCPSCETMNIQADKDKWCVLCQEDLETLQK